MPLEQPADGEWSRRAFLGGLVGAALLPGCGARVGSKGNPAGWFALLSDPHIAADRSTELHGQVMANNLEAVIREILAADDAPRSVLINGDLALTDGQVGDYQTFLKLVEPLRTSGVTMHATLGNHDDRRNCRAALPGLEDAKLDRRVGVIEHDDLRLILLDSLDRPNLTRGELGADQREWLAQTLDTRPEIPALIFVHHHLDATTDAALNDTTELLDLLKTKRQAKAVVVGHAHVWSHAEVDGLHVINLPAIGYKFARKEPLGWCAFRPKPGGGELELRCVGRRQDRQGERIAMTWRDL